MVVNTATFRRYALYVTPTGAPWAAFAQAWLEADLPDLPALPLPLSDITATPRRYGLHGTIVPPFHLASSSDGPEALHKAVAAFCASQRPVMSQGLTLSSLGRFLALLPIGDTAALRSLATSALELCDPYRAPLSRTDLERHLAKGLNPTQEALLRRWGYPYVREAFHFHITLTSKLPKRTLPAIREALDARFVPLLPRPWAVDHLSLMGEDAQGQFHIIERFELA